MTCDECKERVFALIEREPTDPNGVRAALQTCPECAALFNEMKAALETASHLPNEEPPAHLDATILRAAAARNAKGSVTDIPRNDGVPKEPAGGAPRRGWFQPPQWAMAAVAILAVGIGVYSLPQALQMETAATPFARELAPDETFKVAQEATPEGAAAPEEPESGDGLGTLSSQDALAKDPVADIIGMLDSRDAPAKEQPPPAPTTQERRASQKTTLREDASGGYGKGAGVRSKRKRAATPAASAAPEQSLGRASAAQGTIAGGGGEAKARSELAGMDMEADQGDTDEDANVDQAVHVAGESAKKACEKSIAKYTKQIKTDAKYVPTAETQLLLGRCYRKLDDTKNAKVWFERAAKHPSTKKRAEAELKAVMKR